MLGTQKGVEGKATVLPAEVGEEGRGQITQSLLHQERDGILF